MDSFTADQAHALAVAHRLADMGVPIFSAHKDSSNPGEFHYPKEWQHTKAGQASHNWIDRWRPGMALCMVTGVVFDVIDVDPRNGGDLGDLDAQGAIPEVYGVALTPSAGSHNLIARTHLAKGKPAKGIDLQAGADDGQGRGFIFLAPTVRPSKFGPHQGQDVAYRWTVEPQLDVMILGRGMDVALDRLIELCQLQRGPRRHVPSYQGPDPAADMDDLFTSAADILTPATADAMITEQCRRVRDAVAGEINSTLGGAARCLGRFVGGGYLAEDHAAEMLLDALDAGGVHSDSWNVAHGKKWTAAGVIADGLAKGALEPWQVAEAGKAASSSLSQGEDAAPGNPVNSTSMTYPRLLVESPAVMAYWLQQEMGQGRLAGFFARQGQVVHTPRMNELGYVPAPPDGDNGPAEIRPVTPDTLAAKLQFLYACYKSVKNKETDGWDEVPAMFPTAAAKAVVNAPEALSGLRTLRGITHTPMVRKDGSVLASPGYDPATGYLFLPGPGVDVPAVPEVPSDGDRLVAMELLGEMIAGFPFATDEDRANYLGLLLTPLLRELAPPSYKLFGISAHQPGSGKSLLAEIAGLIHGAVFRSEVPDDEAEWRKMTSGLLSTTSAPVVILDNVSGVLRSAVLAGLLTASGEIQERELGKSSNLTFTNDRVWVVTGNNMSLGGDLARRTITVMIDPDMANPETRTDFAIKDLPRWVAEHRNVILWSLLVLIRSWVAAGRPAPPRAQSDSFAAWETAVGGILKHAGVAGPFDQESGKRASAGGDDDGLQMLLVHLLEKFGDHSWSVAEALNPDGGEMVLDSRDWVPGVVLDKLARSEASGRASFGKWLRFRLGRWVTTSEGAHLVLRESGMEKNVMRWKVERR
jgi:hypothetical protein